MVASSCYAGKRLTGKPWRWPVRRRAAIALACVAAAGVCALAAAADRGTPCKASPTARTGPSDDFCPEHAGAAAANRSADAAVDGGARSYPSDWTFADTPERRLTIVTAFFNLGPFGKGSRTATRGPRMYRTWMRMYSLMANGVVGYFDDADTATYFADIRRQLPTKIVLVNRSSLWSFSLQHKIQTVFDDPAYPKKYPKSTSAAYVCAMHAKVDLIEAAVAANYFGSDRFAWADIGLFRYLSSAEADSRPFVLQAPRCYRPGCVAFAEVYEMSRETVANVMRQGIDWVGGGFFLADGDTMSAFCKDYRRSAVELLARGLANHDQSVILAMYSPRATRLPNVTLQVFVPDDDPWFYFAYTLRQVWVDASTGHCKACSGRKCLFRLVP